MATKKGKKEARSDDEIAREQWQRYVRARDNGHVDYLDSAKKCSDFYEGNGKQWEAALRQKLEAEGKPVLEINLCLSTTNAVLGQQTSKRAEFKYKPRAGGTENSATVLTKLVSAIKDQNHYDWLESQVFADGLIEDGRGFFDVRMAWEKNMMGNIAISADDPRTIILDPDAKDYDPETWTEIFETRWMSPDEIEALYGEEKAEQLRTAGINSDRFDSDSIIWEKEGAFGDTHLRESASTFGMALSDDEQKAIRSVRVISRQHVKRTVVKKFVDLITGDMSIVPTTWSDKKVMEFSERYQLAIISTTDKRIRWTTTADKVVLHDDWSPYKTFTKIPFFCYFRRGKPFGLIANLISPQEQLNKLSSQELHILNTTANSGWIVEQNSLVGMTADDLRNQGAETGLVLEVRKGAEIPTKILPNQPPTGVERAAMKSAQFIKEISGVNEALLGFDSPEVSGVALENKQFRGQVQMQVPFDNLNRTRYLVASKMLELIQQFYTEERVFTITTSGIDFQDEENQQLLINHKTAAGDVINDVTIGEYEIVLALVPARDSFDDEQFAEVINMREIGIQIPDDRIVEYSHLARKQELAEEIRQITGRGKLTPEQQQMQQWQQEMQMRLAEANVSKAEAEVQEIQAQQMLTMAEAQMKAGGTESPEYQMAMEELSAKLTMAREQLQLRRDLARMSAQGKLDHTVVATQGKLVEGTVMERERRKTALLTGAQKAAADIKKERAKPKPKAPVRGK